MWPVLKICYFWKRIFLIFFPSFSCESNFCRRFDLFNFLTIYDWSFQLILTAKTKLNRWSDQLDPSKIEFTQLITNFSSLSWPMAGVTFECLPFFSSKIIRNQHESKNTGRAIGLWSWRKKNKLGRNGFTRTLAGFTSSSKFYRVYGIGGGGMLEVRDRPLWLERLLFIFISSVVLWWTRRPGNGASTESVVSATVVKLFDGQGSDACHRRHRSGTIIKRWPCIMIFQFIIRTPSGTRPVCARRRVMRCGSVPYDCRRRRCAIWKQ